MMQTKMEKASTHVFEHLKADCFIYTKAADWIFCSILFMVFSVNYLQ